MVRRRRGLRARSPLDKLSRSSLKRPREGRRQSHEHWKCFQGNVGETAEIQGGAHMDVYERIPSWTELNWTEPIVETGSTVVSFHQKLACIDMRLQIVCIAHCHWVVTVYWLSKAVGRGVSVILYVLFNQIHQERSWTENMANDTLKEIVIRAGEFASNVLVSCKHNYEMWISLLVTVLICW